MPKKKYKGIYEMRHAVYELYGWAFSEKQAHQCFCRQIARKQGVENRVVFYYFVEHPEAVKIAEMEKEKQ
jgi:hypothetical protein